MSGRTASRERSPAADLPMLSATILSVRVDEHEVYAQTPGEQSVVAR